MLQITITQMRRKWPWLTMKSTLTRWEFRITKTISSTSTSDATIALAPRLDCTGVEGPAGVPGAGSPSDAGMLRLSSGQPVLMRGV
jgi:hypothetical protein